MIWIHLGLYSHGYRLRWIFPLSYLHKGEEWCSLYRIFCCIAIWHVCIYWWNARPLNQSSFRSIRTLSLMKKCCLSYTRCRCFFFALIQLVPAQILQAILWGMTVFNVVLWYFTFVFLFLFRKEIHGKTFLEKRRALVLFVCQNTFDSRWIPFLFTAGRGYTFPHQLFAYPFGCITCHKASVNIANNLSFLRYNFR